MEYLIIINFQMKISRDPPLPLDLETPYNEETSPNNGDRRVPQSKDDDDEYQSDQPMSNVNLNHIQRGILGGTFNPYSDSNIRNTIITRSNIHTRGVLTGSFDGVNGAGGNRVNNNFTATLNGNSHGGSNVNSRSNNQNIEIITKNGLSKKPSIIGSDFQGKYPQHSPDHIFANSPTNKHHPSNNNNHPSYGYDSFIYNKLDDTSNKQLPLVDRKSTCMLYLQADHTFFQKMGSDEASIEAITRHVQRANIIYRNTGELYGTWGFN